MGLCGFSPKISAIVAGLLTLMNTFIFKQFQTKLGEKKLRDKFFFTLKPGSSPGFILVNLGNTFTAFIFLCNRCFRGINTAILSIVFGLSLQARFNLNFFLLSTGGECASVEINVETDNGTIALSWPEMGSQAAYRTYSWILVYLVLSIFWVIGSLLLLIATVSNIRGIRGVLLRSPWLVLTAAFLILDVITSVSYTVDISYTGNLKELLNFIGLVVEPSDAINSSSTSPTFGYLTMAPSILAAIVFSRIVLGWGLNVILFIHVAHDAKNDETKPTPAPPEPRQPYKEYLKKLSTVGPIPDVEWDPYQRKRSDLPVMKPLKVPSPPNERKRKQSDYQQYLFYAKNSSQSNYLDDIKSEPPTPAVTAAEPNATYMQDGSVAGRSTPGGERS